MNRYDLQDRVAVITGGARGLGYAIAESLQLAGATLCLWDLDTPQLIEAGLRLSDGGVVESTGLDISDATAVRAATESSIARFGRIDILINNAGITGGNAPLWEIDPDTWRRVIDVNLVGSFLTSRSIVPQMLRRRYGRIVNVASVAGKEGNPNASHYSASKAGLIGLTKSLGKELATSGILVNCVTPAAADTDLLAQMTPQHIDYMRSKIPMNRFLDPKEIASMVCWLSSADCAFSTGAVFDISGGRSSY